MTIQSFKIITLDKMKNVKGASLGSYLHVATRGNLTLKILKTTGTAVNWDISCILTPFFTPCLIVTCLITTS